MNMMTLPMVKQLALAETQPFWRSYWNAEAGCRMIVTVPTASEALWTEYLDGAVKSYRKHGVASVVDYAAIRDGRSTALVFLMIGAHGRVVGGVRIQGPYTSPEQSHALAEWAGEPGLPTVHAMLSARIPSGVVEVKTAWVSDAAENRRALADCIPRTGVHAMTLLGARYAFATSAVHTLRRWASTGGTMPESLAPVPYPDERYRTSMLWVDRATFADHADPTQLRAIMSEQAQLCGGQYWPCVPLLETVRG